VVLKYWVATQFSDLDEDMIAKVYNFVDNTLKNDGYEELAAMLKKEITTKVRTAPLRRWSYTGADKTLNRLRPDETREAACLLPLASSPCVFPADAIVSF
jgi:hypothetical protein